MKPRTELQRTVAKLSAKLPPLTEQQERWIKRHAIPAMAYIGKKNSWCTACGQAFPTATQSAKRCPVCGAKFESTSASPRTSKRKDSYYTTIFTTCKGFQVVRHFLAKRVSYKYKEPAWEIGEAVQVWIDAQGRLTVMARNVYGMPFYYDSWNFNTPLTVKDYSSRTSCSYRGSRYEISSYSNRICRILPIIKRNGFKGDFHNITPSTLLGIILSDNNAETLLKTGQTALLRLMCNGRKIRHMHAVAICNRNGYIVKDAQMWSDYVDLLDYFGLDTHNAHYVCPADLHAEHDKLVRRKRKILEAERLRQKREEAEKAENEYKEQKGRFFGVLITGKGISLHVLQSVAEFLEEGEAMHHCVFTNDYYKKADTLILSAQEEATGKRLETVEYNMATHKVVQSRGRYNEMTEHHSKIVALAERELKRLKI